MSRTIGSKPLNKIRCGGLIDHIEWCLVVPSEPVDVSASLEQVFGRTPLATVACAPKRLSNHLRIWARRLGKERVHSVKQPEGSGIAQPGMRTSLNESPGRCPVAEPARVGERAATAEDCPSRFDVGSRIKQHIEHGDVITARGPVQRRFGVKAETAVSVHISASSDQAFYHGRTVRKVPRPVGCRVQQSPIAVLVTNPGLCEPWIDGEQPFEPRKIARLYSRRCCHDTRILGGHDGYRIMVTRGAGHGGQPTSSPGGVIL